MVDVAMADARDRLLEFLDSRDCARAAGNAVTSGLTLMTDTAGPLEDSQLQVTVETMPLRRRGAGVVVPMQWTAVDSQTTGTSVILDADLEVHATSGGATRISLVGSYRPPQRTQVHSDHSLLGKVTDVVATEFLKRLARQVAG